MTTVKKLLSYRFCSCRSWKRTLDVEEGGSL